MGPHVAASCMARELQANAAWGEIGGIVPSHRTVRRVWSDSLHERGVAVLPSDRGRGYRRAYLGLIRPKSGNESLRGPQIRLGMGPYRCRSVAVEPLAGAAPNLHNGHL